MPDGDKSGSMRSRDEVPEGEVEIRVLATLDSFYGSMAQISFTLLGLWWIVVQFKYQDFMRDRRRRIQAYDTSLYFVLPGIMSLISLLSTNGVLWRVTFTTAAVLGAVEAVFLLATTRRQQGSRLWRSAHYAGCSLYVLVAVFALLPVVADKIVGLHVKALQVEGVFLALIVFLGRAVDLDPVLPDRPVARRPPGVPPLAATPSPGRPSASAPIEPRNAAAGAARAAASSGRPRALREAAAPSAARARSTSTPWSRHLETASSNRSSAAAARPSAAASSARPVTSAAAWRGDAPTKSSDERAGDVGVPGRQAGADDLEPVQLAVDRPAAVRRLAELARERARGPAVPGRPPTPSPPRRAPAAGTGGPAPPGRRPASPPAARAPRRPGPGGRAPATSRRAPVP